MTFQDFSKKAALFLATHGYRDEAVFYTILSRLVTLGLGPLVVLAVGSLLGAEERGVYFVFGSLLQLRGLIDLGFSQSSQQLLANRFADLTFDPLLGVNGNNMARSQFLNLAKFTCRMYQLIGFTTFGIVGLVGYFFLCHQLNSHQGIHWQGAWWGMMACVGLGVGTSGIIVVADGANQLALTNRYRFWTELSAIAMFLIVLALGGGLWASAGMAFARLWLPIPVTRRLGCILHSQIRTAVANAIDFRKTIWPLQSRNMVVWGLGFLCYYAYNPFTLFFLGPAAAGIVGMTLQIANMTSGLALVWYNTKLSRLGNLAGANDHREVERLHLAGLRLSMIFWVVIAASVWSLVFLLRPFVPFLATRLAPPLALGMFMLGAGAYIWNHTRASMIRAFCVEVFTPLALIQGFVTPLLLWLLLPRLGVDGAALVYMLMMLVGAIWSEFAQRSFNRKYHNTLTAQLSDI
jgi:hypothetical protein